MKPSKINYRTDIVKPYCAAIRACETKEALIAEIESNWAELCPDALEQAREISESDWQFARKNADKAKHAEQIVKTAGAVLLPLVIMQIGLLATEFCVPDGCAYIRMRELAEEAKR